jgi:hypothetical protein
MVEGITQTFSIGMAIGLFDIKGQLLNDLIPEVKPISLEAFLKKSLQL